MNIAISCDHAGFELKEFLKSSLAKNGFKLIDLGTNNTKAVDYPDFAQKTAEAILAKQAYRGIVLCGSGVGASIAANKFKGIRAAICHDTYSAHQGVEHDDMNILVLGARIIGPCLALEIAQAFLNAKFSQEKRYIDRINKIIALENCFGSQN